MSKFFKLREEAVGSAYSAGDYEESYPSLDKFKEAFSDRLQVNVLSKTEEELQFELVGVDASIANALRRIMLSEVPTMAIEQIIIENNTSIIQDDVLAHRLGLIPIKANPDMFEAADGELNESNSIEFKLQVTCQRSAHSQVYSSDLQWVPLGDQMENLKGDTPAPVESDILIAKMKAGQEISLRAVCVKGIGKEHAKWSPVATASYRILPVIRLEKEFKGEEAKQLVKSCPMKVFDIEDIGNTVQAKVANPRNCTMCRECIRGPGMQQHVSLLRKADHFIFTVEAVGVIPPEVVVKKAIQVLKQKCEAVAKGMEELA